MLHTLNFQTPDAAALSPMLHTLNFQTPDAAAVRLARVNAGLSQGEAARLVDLSGQPRWAEYEAGRKSMDATRFALFLLLTDQHPLYALRARGA